MPEQAMNSYVPEEVPLPPAPEKEVFTELQWTTLMSLADTFIPSIRTAENARPSDKVVSASQLKAAISMVASGIRDPDAVQIATRYLDENASSNPAYRALLHRLFSVFVHEEGRNGLAFILNALK